MRGGLGAVAVAVGPGRGPVFAVAVVAAGKRDLDADDRLDAASAQAVANSKAPNRLPLSVIATAGIALGAAELDQLLDLDRPGRQRIGGVGAQMDEIGERHGSDVL